MSGIVIVYQLAILASILGTCVLFNKKLMAIVAIFWSTWTIALVFTSWLFILQFGTIMATYTLGLRILSSARYPSIQRKFRKGIIFAALILGALLFLLFYYEYSRKTDYSAPVNRSPKQISSIIVPTPKVRDQTPQELYTTTLREIEQRHPELNPDLPGYRQDLVGAVANKMKGYISQGFAKHVALRMAVADMEQPTLVAPLTWEPSRSANTSPTNRQGGLTRLETPRPERSPCVYKDVMSDADYVACGARPPQQ